MTKATILSLEQTENAGLFTIIFEDEDLSEFVRFVNKFKDDAVRKNDLRIILNQIDTMMLKGFEERRFRSRHQKRHCSYRKNPNIRCRQ